MRYIKRSFCFIILALLLSSCASMSGTGQLLPEENSTRATAVNVIKNAEIGLTLAYRTVKTEADIGIFTKVELQGVLDNLNRVAAGLDKAQEARRMGLFEGALKEALSSSSLLGDVQSFLAERIKDQQRRQP